MKLIRQWRQFLNTRFLFHLTNIIWHFFRYSAERLGGRVNRLVSTISEPTGSDKYLLYIIRTPTIIDMCEDKFPALPIGYATKAYTDVEV